MQLLTDRTRNFKKKIEIERQALSSANNLSHRLKAQPLLGLSHGAIDLWLSNLSEIMPLGEVEKIATELKELALATGLLADQSRCAVAEGKVSADIPYLYEKFNNQILVTLRKHT